MSQTQLTAFFNSRKRPASEDLISSKNKIPHIARPLVSSLVPGPKNKLKSSQITQDEIKQTVNHTIPQQEGTKNFAYSSGQKTLIANVFGKKQNATNVAKEPAPTKSEIVNVARRELSLGDIRKKLASSSRLAELRDSADRISKGIQQLRESGSKRNLKEFRSIDVEVPISPSKRSLNHIESVSPEWNNNEAVPKRPLISPRKVFVSPVKSPKKIPAYIKHASLASSSSSLPLPHHYRFLAELFRGMETVVSLLYNRNEKITFNKLKPSVQEMLKRNFTEKHLAQIKHLVPDFYNFEIQKVKNFISSNHKDAYELVIAPNIPKDIKLLNPSVLLERRRYFYDILMKLVKRYHLQFLQSLDPPMEIPDDKLFRWHPEFELEKVPEIECGKLPEIPNTEKLTSAQDVLAKARELFKCNTKMDRALQKLAEAKSRGLTEQEKAVTGITDSKMNDAVTQTSQPSSSTMPILNPALRNLPASLLEKVKAKQAAKALEAMTRTTESEQKYLIYSRLPDLGRTLRNIFVTERKNVLALNVILSKLGTSFKSSVTNKDLQKDITVLSEQMPEWIQLHEIRNTMYLKLDRSMDLKSVINKLESLVEKYKPTQV